MGTKRVLILSNGPVPTPEHTQVEGGGLRCWGLAKGLLQNSTTPSLDITVAYEQSYKKDEFTQEYEGINIDTWTIKTVANIIKNYDSIVVSYCMGDLSMTVVENIQPDQQLVLDCYVPIYVEVSARESSRIDEEYAAFNVDVPKWGAVLRRGDLYLCASDAQKKFYKGVIAALGRTNPVTYGTDPILVVPYGIYRDNPMQQHDPIKDLIGKDDVYKILWFGGIYPWFDIRELADAVAELNKTLPARLIVVGAKNPFNNHPDFLERYEEFITHIKKNNLSRYVYLQDWINFNDRADWYLGADIVVVFNKIGEENTLAWRTRLVDFMWADLPVLTNGGDPLGEKMLENQAAIRIEDTEKQQIADALHDVFNKGEENIALLKKNMSLLKKEFYWDVVTRQLATKIAKGHIAPDATRRNSSTSNPSGPVTGGEPLTISRVVSKAKKIPAYARKHGTIATGRAIQELLSRKLSNKKLLPKRAKAAYVFVSHQLDNSGAPYILMDMAIECKENSYPVEFYTYLPLKRPNATKLERHHIKPHVLMKKEMVPDIVEGDTVILNTVAHSETTKDTFFRAAERGRIRLIWYLHEDHPEILFRHDEKKRIKRLLSNDKLVIAIAAKQMRQRYSKFFETDKNIILLPYKHIVPQKYHKAKRTPSDFNKKLTFVLPGTVGDGRKGQLPVLYAFIYFYENYFKVDRKRYRDFELVFIGLDKDYLSRQIEAHASMLDHHFRHYKKISWEEDLEVVSSSNVTICYSLGECLPLFVFEGMIAGHVLLRNDSSGMEEQLFRGENGFLIETRDYMQLVSVIEQVLNKNKTSDELLAKMSRKSYEIAKDQENTNYGSILGAL